MNNEISRKTKSRNIALRNNYFRFDADWKIFRHRNDDTFSVTHTKRSRNDSVTNISYWYFWCSGGTKNPKRASAKSEEIA